MKNTADTRFYVYGYFDTRKPSEYIYFDDNINLELKFDFEPFYIGKGQDGRMFDHLNKSSLKSQSYKNNKIKEIIKETGDIPLVSMLHSGMTEQNALSLEKKFVALIGRSDLKKGPLTNLTDAGDGGGYNPSEETRRKMSKSKQGKYLGKDNPNFGKHLSDESKEKLRIINTGKKLSKETKEKISIIHLGKKLSKETIAKIVEQISGDKHYLFGKHQSEETKKKISIKTSGENNPNYGKIPTQETRNKISLKNSGKSMKTKLLNLYGEEIGMQKFEEMISRNDKAVLQYSLDGEFINIFKSESEAGRVLNISPSNISSCINERTKTAGDFMWKNYDGGEINKKIMPVKFEENKNKKRVIQYDMKMNKINEFESTMDVKRKMNLDSSWISKVCRGLNKSAGGFIWRYADEI